MTKQTIKDDGSIDKYATVIPHIADDDLDPFQMRLYIHYKKIFALKGTCDESVRETAKACRMSTKTITKARDELASLGYIAQEKPTPAEARKGKTVHVTLADRWADNMTHYAYAKGVVDLPQGVVRMPQPVADLPQLNSADKSEAVANMLRIDSKDKDSKESTTPKKRESNPWYDAIQKVWGYTAARNRDMEKMLRATATKSPYKEYNLETPLTSPDQLLNWKAWYFKFKNTRPDAILLSNLEKVQSSIGEYQNYLEKRKAPIPLPTEKIENHPADAASFLAGLVADMESAS